MSAEPKIEAHVICAECRAPFVLRRARDIIAMRIIWLWQRDCKHKKAGMVPVKGA